MNSKVKRSRKGRTNNNNNKLTMVSTLNSVNTHHNNPSIDEINTGTTICSNSNLLNIDDCTGTNNLTTTSTTNMPVSLMMDVNNSNVVVLAQFVHQQLNSTSGDIHQINFSPELSMDEDKINSDSLLGCSVDKDSINDCQVDENGGKVGFITITLLFL